MAAGLLELIVCVVQDFVPIAPPPKSKRVLTEHQRDMKQQKWFVTPHSTHSLLSY